VKCVMHHVSTILVLSAVGALMILPVASSTYAGETLSVEELIGRLQNRAPEEPGTRDISVEELERRQRNRLYVPPEGPAREETRRRVQEEVKRHDLPSVDLEIYFDYDSAALKPESLPQLRRLGDALEDRRLKGRAFLIAGHTDAKGSDAYNQRLSERRARSVKSFLISNFAVNPNALKVIGYGEEQLKYPNAPEAAANRRVQVINWRRMSAGR